MIKEQMFIGAALIAGVAVGYFLRGETAAPKATEVAPPPSQIAPRGKIADAGDAASNAALRQRIAELERELARRTDVPAAPAKEQVAASPQAAMPPKNPRERMEELKKNDPERYTQMTNRMAKFRQRQLRRAQGKLDFLDSVDTSGMSAGAKRTHARFQDLLMQREELQENIGNFDLSEDARRENFEKMHKLDDELRSVSAEERRNLLGETAKGLGLSGEDATAYSATIEQLFEATESNHHGPHGPPPPGR